MTAKETSAKRDGPDGWRIGAHLDPGNVPGEDCGGWDGVRSHGAGEPTRFMTWLFP